MTQGEWLLTPPGGWYWHRQTPMWSNQQSWWAPWQVDQIKHCPLPFQGPLNTRNRTGSLSWALGPDICGSRLVLQPSCPSDSPTTVTLGSCSWVPHTHSGVRAFELEGLPGYTAHSQFPNSPLLKESFHDQSHCHPPSLLSRPLPFLLSSTSDYLTCSMYFSVDCLPHWRRAPQAGRCSVPTPPPACLQHRGQACTQQGGAQSPPVSSTGDRPGLSREVLSSLPSGQACTRQGGAQSLPTAPISSIEVRPALCREVLSPLPSPAQRSGLHSANGEQMHHQHWRDRHTGCWALCLQKGVLGPDSKKHWLMTCWWTLKGKKVPPVNRV